MNSKIKFGFCISFLNLQLFDHKRVLYGDKMRCKLFTNFDSLSIVFSVVTGMSLTMLPALCRQRCLSDMLEYKFKVDKIMARRCDICGKGTISGSVVPRKGQAKKKGGVGQHVGVTKKREFRPNIVSVKALINGTPKTIKVCTRCLRSGRVEKVV